MAALFESDSEGEEFLGFDVEGEPQRSNVESESDITVSTVIMEELSDISVTSSESGEARDKEWNLIPDPVVVNPFVANTGIVHDVSRFSILYFFYLMLYHHRNDAHPRNDLHHRNLLNKTSRLLCHF